MFWLIIREWIYESFSDVTTFYSLFQLRAKKSYFSLAKPFQKVYFLLVYNIKELNKAHKRLIILDLTNKRVKIMWIIVSFLQHFVWLAIKPHTCGEVCSK